MTDAPQSALGQRRSWMPALAALVLLILAGAGCADDESAAPGRRGSLPGTEIDSDSVAIVVVAPAAAEILEALGRLDRVVGIADFGPWPAAIADLPSVGSYDNPNAERLLSLGAELVLTTVSQAAAPSHRRLQELGIEVVALDTATYDGVFRTVERIGQLLDRRDEARAIVARMQEELAGIERQAAGLKTRRVLVVVGRDPLYVAGPGSHLDRLIAIAGGTNVAHDAISAYQRFSSEAVLERMPEVIIDTSDNRPGALRGVEPGWWGQWPSLPAVADGAVYWVDPSRLVIPGIRLPEMARLMSRLIHPETFGEADARELSAIGSTAAPGPSG